MSQVYSSNHTDPGRSTGIAIRAESLSKTFGRHPALENVSFEVRTGSVFGVIGPNGAGKTTTMRLLLDIIRPTSGRCEVLGVDPRAAGPELRRRIGFLPGELALQGRTSGRKLLHHYAKISGTVAPGRIEALAERLNLDLDRQVRKLSKGNKQKLGLVQAFMHEPDLLVLDEPTGGLDPLMQQEFLTMVREASNKGQTVFLSSHVLSEIEQAADEVAILRGGRVVTVSTVDELRETAVRRLRVGVTREAVAAVVGLLGRVPGLGNVRAETGLAVAGPGPTDSVFVSATLEGDIQPFIQALSTIAIRDLVVEEPDLEESVLKLYSAPARESSHV
jgi:ABC-2 type transport system ATP-binding protein